MLITKLDRGEGLAEMQQQRNHVVLGVFWLSSLPADASVSLESLFLVVPLNQ